MGKRRFFLLLAFSIGMTIVSEAQLRDKDGHYYKTTRIGQQEWITENLDVSHFRNGDSIAEFEDPADWEKAGLEGRPAWCYYNNDTLLGRKYHKLYNFYALIDPRGLLPEGWHVPTSEECLKLSSYLGNENVAAAKMKSATVWNGTNESGFTALAAGYRNKRAEFAHLGNLTSWWTSSEADSRNAWSYSLGNGSALSRSYDNKIAGLYIRCLRD